MQSHAKKSKKKWVTAAAQEKAENGNATNAEESETENDETDARSVDSEEEDYEEEDTKAEKKTTKKSQNVNVITRLFLSRFFDFMILLYLFSLLSEIKVIRN